MEKVIFQIKYNDKMYNKFILLAKEVNKEGKDIYKAKELIANKDIHIQYYNRLFVEGDFDNSLYESEFGLNYKETSFLQELGEEDNKLATYLTDFCEWYQWGLVKYPNGRYNILDLEFDNDEFVGYFGNENTDTGTLKDCIERVFYRMVDYYTDEEDYERVEDMEKDINDFIELGKKYNLFDDNDIKRLKEWLEEEKEYFKEEE